MKAVPGIHTPGGATPTLASLGLDPDLATFAVPADTTVSAFAKTYLDDTTAAATKATLLVLTPTQQILTVGTGTYTTPANCRAILIEVQAAGGGGGGCSGSATQAGAGGGGGSGGWLRKLIASPDATYAYTAGAKGAGGTAGTNDGSAGADSTFGAGGGLLTAKGGTGGIGSATGIIPNYVPPGSGGAIATGGDLNEGGNPGQFGLTISASQATGGPGAPSHFGGGAPRTDGNVAGTAAVGHGGGGSGGSVRSVNTARAGGDGGDGVILVTEFY